MRAIPPKPQGDGPNAYFMQAVWDELFGGNSRMIVAPGTLVSHTTRGKRIVVRPAVQPGAPGIPFKFYQITTLKNADYYMATLYDPVKGQISGGEVAIAKPLTTRMTAKEIIDGITINYVYRDISNAQSDSIRKATQFGGAITEWHVIHPRYTSDVTTDISQRLVVVTTMTGGTGVMDGNGVQINLLEMSFREWAYQQDQSGML